jgi:hypothetical protein
MFRHHHHHHHLHHAGLVVGGYSCNGVMSSTVPADGRFVLTSFGGGSDTQSMACGGTADGTWYYTADHQRWPCGTLLQITNPTNGLSVVAQVADSGPDICIEQAAGMPALDASPTVSQYLFNDQNSGVEDHRIVQVTVIDDQSTPLGPTTAPTQAGMINGTTFLWVMVISGVVWIWSELGQRESARRNGRRRSRYRTGRQ